MTPERVAVSPWNRVGLEDSSLFSRSPKIADCTLRDGEQQAGLVFRRNEKVEIARRLDDIGVDDIEVGTPAVSEDDRLAIEEIAASRPRALLTALARATKADVDLVAACGVGGVRISFPISARQRAAKLHMDDAQYLKVALEISHYAKSRGLIVIFSPYDTTRSDQPLLAKLLKAFADERVVDRVRLVDTVGGATPQAIHSLVRFMLDAGQGLPIEVHCHNDFGLATANTLAGALAGAEYLSVTVNGLGERGGNTPLEEVVAALEFLYGVPTHVDLSKLTALSRRVEELSEITLQPHKPVVGTNAFSHETGMVVAGVLEDPFTAEPYSPELVGQTRQILIGKKSGRRAVEFRLEQLGIALEPAEVAVVVDEVKSLATAQKRAVDDVELAGIAGRAKRSGSSGGSTRVETA